MLTKDFYQLIDNEINALVEKYQNDPFLQKHKEGSSQRKSYGFLIWFLNVYAKTANYVDYITDGENDSSCDIIFDKKDHQNNTIFYIVQAKWRNESNALKEADNDDIKKALSDFQTVLSGRKQNLNQKLEVKIQELDKHIKSNGDVKFIFLTLSEYKGQADNNIKAFLNNDEKRKCEVIDINRLKNDYIEREFKGITPENPLENYLNPEESEITIKIERLSQKDGNFIKIEKPFDAYVFLIRPKIIFELFEKYGFALFYKNVRNPLLESQFNEEIKQTASDNPSYFWYYNNGITAITYPPLSIGKSATSFKINGLQIINGAQTVYAIYRAYKEASRSKRKQMDGEALITLRLLKSGGKDFDLNVTRYTNSQNPVEDRDFCANDEVQIRLQQESFKTKYWYEKRRGEFREPEKLEKMGIQIVSNDVFASKYLAYYLQEQPTRVINNHERQASEGKNLNFISYKDDPEGFYEKIFNNQTSFKDMLCSFYVYNIVLASLGSSYDSNSFPLEAYPLLTLFKTVFTKYLNSKFPSSKQTIDTTRYIIEHYEKGEFDVFIKASNFIMRFIIEQLVKTDNKEGIEFFERMEVFFKLVTAPLQFEKLKEKLEELDLKVEDIESIVLEEDNEIENNDD
jgi:hypothetical protein